MLPLYGGLRRPQGALAPLTTFVIPWKPYCTAPCPDNSLDKGPRPGVSQLKLYFAMSKNVTAG